MITHQVIKNKKLKKKPRNGFCIISASIESLSLRDIYRGYRIFSLEVLQMVLLAFNCGLEI